MEWAFMILLVGCTSLVAYLVGGWKLGLARESFSGAVGRMLEFVGASVMFLVANLTVGLAAILVVRNMTGRFVSAYLLNDVSIVVLSTLQGLLFECWRERSPLRRR
jgi:hypothetical protein